MRTYSDIINMSSQDSSIGLHAHYRPLSDLINKRRYKKIIEIGTAYGGNAAFILSETEIESLTCIDPYKFYPAMPGFSCQEEYDTLFQFAQARLSFWPHAEILRLTSKEAFPILEPADLIFLDGSHEYDDVKWECENYNKLVKPGGVLSGHDYNIFEGVNKAVDEFSRETGKEVKQLGGNIWYMEF
jgi:predicted O-methyltransferase YrrM